MQDIELIAQATEAIATAEDTEAAALLQEACMMLSLYHHVSPAHVTSRWLLNAPAFGTSGCTIPPGFFPERWCNLPLCLGLCKPVCIHKEASLPFQAVQSCTGMQATTQQPCTLDCAPASHQQHALKLQSSSLVHAHAFQHSRVLCPSQNTAGSKPMYTEADDEGVIPLMLAAAHADTRLAAKIVGLLEPEALTVTDKQGSNALMHALEAAEWSDGNTMFNLFVAVHPEPPVVLTAKRSDGRRPLHLAAAKLAVNFRSWQADAYHTVDRSKDRELADRCSSMRKFLHRAAGIVIDKQDQFDNAGHTPVSIAAQVNLLACSCMT